jgi:hypothetical protein
MNIHVQEKKARTHPATCRHEWKHASDFFYYRLRRGLHLEVTFPLACVRDRCGLVVEKLTTDACPRCFSGMHYTHDLPEKDICQLSPAHERAAEHFIANVYRCSSAACSFKAVHFVRRQ